MPSYRPISFLPVFSKVFERLFLKRLLPILEQKNKIPYKQFGFNRIVQEVTNVLENKLYCLVIFLDISQTFHKV